MTQIKNTKKIIRQIRGKAVQDPESIMAVMYNQASGAQKNLQVGHALRPLTENGSFTTDVSMATPLALGGSFAIYNNSGSLKTINFGKTIALVSLAAGATDAEGNVGIPLQPNAWAYLANNDRRYVISSSNTVLFFQVIDETYIIDNGVSQLE